MGISQLSQPARLWLHLGIIEELIVTDHGRPVLRIQAIATKRTVEEVLGTLQGRVVYHEDINAPTLDEWSDA